MGKEKEKVARELDLRPLMRMKDRDWEWRRCGWRRTCQEQSACDS